MLSISGSSLSNAMLRPFASALMLESTTKTKWILKKREATLFTANAPLLPLLPGDTAPFFAIAVSDPLTLLASFEDALSKSDPSLLEGMRGIAQERLHSATGRTEIEKMVSDLFGNGMSMMIAASPGSPRFLVEGKATSTQAMQAWIQSIRSHATPAIIRSQTFLHGDRRIDITAAPMGEEIVRTENGWEKTSAGSGSQLQLLMATKGKIIVIGNDSDLLEEGMRRIDHPTSDKELRGIFVGTANIPWLLQHPGGSFLTAKESSFLESVSEKKTETIRFDAEDGRDALTVRVRHTQ